MFRDRLARSAGAAAGSLVSIGLAWCASRALHVPMILVLAAIIMVTAASHAWSTE